MVFASLDAYKTTMQHAKENTKQIFDINTKAAKTLEQNTREVTKAAQDASSRFNASFKNNQGNTAKHLWKASQHQRPYKYTGLILEKTILLFLFKKVEMHHNYLFKIIPTINL